MSLAVFVVLAVAASSSAIMRRRGGTGTDAGDAPTLYDRAAEAAAAGDCATAFPMLEKALAATPEDPDVLNLIGYCQRRTGRLDDAFGSYRRALEARPRFPAARQYLGEAHLQAALREMEILRGYGDEARDEIAALRAALRDAATAAAPRPNAPVTSTERW